MNDIGFNDVMSSYVCGKNTVVDFCYDNPWDDCTGTHTSKAGYASANYDVGYPDHLTSFFGTCVDQTRLPAMVFNDDGCNGDSIRVDLTNDSGTYWDK
jgi:hypothetical protein